MLFTFVNCVDEFCLDGLGEPVWRFARRCFLEEPSNVD